MILAADYPFLDVVGTIAIFSAWVVWVWAVIVLLMNVWHRRDLSGSAKAAWAILLIVVPLVGVCAYLIVAHQQLGAHDERAARQAR
jgi:hypothetical protein